MIELHELVRRIPRGRVTSYSALGRLLQNVATGRMVGRMMRHCPEDVPWWRVVAASGEMPVIKVHPMLENEQQVRLLEEGIECPGARVPKRYFLDDVELEELTTTGRRTPSQPGQS